MSILKSHSNLVGIKLDHNKNTSEVKSQPIKLPHEVLIPMLQHIGAACEPVVKKGDKVLVGQLIGETTGFVCSPIYSSCSGEVIDVVPYRTPFSALCKAVLIKTDGLQTLDESVSAPVIKNKQEFIDAVRKSGVVGLGGAGFPSFIKLDYKKIENVTTLVINAAECEPYITSDNRECIENTNNIIDGILAIQKYLDIPQTYIAIENNKPEAIKALNSATCSHKNIKVVELKSIYPQGAEKSVIYACCGIVVKKGSLPADCGVMVINVSTVGFIGEYLKDGVPLIERRITVDGDCVLNPKNLIVPIGTPIKDIIETCEFSDEYEKILMGGPMMGIPIMNATYPIIKNNNAITFLSDKSINKSLTTACIRCGKCVHGCPMNLMPLEIEKAYDSKNTQLLKELCVDLCINCGCCSYNCPANRHLAQKNQLAKILIKQ
ncbi:MAG: electron transport complex subunit RsxC [Oscillospiraceae bacterium]